jgi:hypothetical protein
MDKSIRIPLIVGVASLLLGMVIRWQFLAGQKKSEISWKFGENQELTINLEKDLIGPDSILKALFSTEISTASAEYWLKKHQELYKVKDLDMVAQIEKLDREENVSKHLRDVSFAHKGPWAYDIDTVLIGIPDGGHQPAAGFANVCENGKYTGKKIKIFSMDFSRDITVEAGGRYTCLSGYIFPNIQLNGADAEALLGTNIFAKYETAIAVIVE